MKLFRPKQQPLQSVEPFERILRALFISQCPYKFSSFLDLKNVFNRFRLFSRDFRLFRFFLPWSACFSSLASPRNLPSWVKYYGKFASFGKECRFTEFIAVKRVRNINICGRILTQFTGLLRTNTVAAKRDLLAGRTGLGKSVSVSLRKNEPYR